MATEIEPEDSLESSDSSSTEHLSIEERMRVRLERALKTENDLLILRAWVPECEQYESLKQHFPRVQLAQKRSVALAQFHSALQTDDHEIIVKNFDPILNGYSLIQTDEWERLSSAVSFVFSSCFIMIGKGTDEQWLQATLLRRFVNALRANNDEDIVSTFDAIEDAGYRYVLALTDQEKDSVDRARRRIAVRQQFQAALSDGYLRPIARAYDDVLSNYVRLMPDEQEQAALAMRFVYMFDALEKSDESLVTAEEDAELLQIYQEIEESPYIQNLRFTTNEQERIQRTKQRKEDFNRVRAALENGKPQEIFDVCFTSPLLNEKHLSEDEQARLNLAKRFVEAFRAHGHSANHPVVVQIYNQILASPYSSQFFFSPLEIPGTAETGSRGISTGGNTFQDELRLIVTIASTPIYNKQFQRVYLVKQQYIWLRQSQWQATSNGLNDVQRWILFQKGTLKDLQSLSEAEQQKISQQVLDDIVDDFLTRKEINGLPLAEKVKVDRRLNTLHEEFKQRDGFLYQSFMHTNRFTDEEVKDTLAIFARREYLTEDLLNRNQSIDAWLAVQRQKQNLIIQYAGQDTFEEERGHGSKGKRNPLRLLDWFKI